MILITGATGSIGLELCKLLAQSNIKARAMCRKEAHLAQFIEMGLEAVIGDFDNPESLKKAMQGCKRLFLLTTAPNQLKHYKIGIDIAIETNVKHIVKISAADANIQSDVLWAKENAQGDHYLRSKNIGWTILKPTGFMQNFLEAKRGIAKGILQSINPNGSIACIDIRDIALVARVVLTEENHNGAMYFLTGSEMVSYKDAAEKLSKAFGYNIKNVIVSSDDMRNRLEAVGVENWRVDSIIAQEVVKNGFSVDVTGEVKRLTGQTPISFEQFAKDYEKQFEVNEQ
ncbi:SDR family oxidoreductase [Pedobacter metabolipauper]|uniref:Uncharacterized protein YbjT (DUF2867 family) n=1 Tax=Pedobacter metabolipauper TaxID=425513 RepID=A0A4R6SQH0_9SPHI|nr:SDR family oxidoreductase [Pedobacter metabolipauper]TDQ06484.1 uncharacterized protein YbjT (DUF2867 family) [Pedobacter metabolipauper]